MSTPENATSGQWDELIDSFVARLERTVFYYHDPKRNSEPGREASVQYGNIRFEVFPTDSGRNVCLIYETPNGSTNQIMISCDKQRCTFSVPALDADGETHVQALEDAVALVRKHIDDVPRQRRDRLTEYIDSWIENGKDLSEIFDMLNRMIQQEMKGGRITYDELSQACRYAVEKLGV